MITVLQTLKIILESGLRPRRTIRGVLFVDEECRQTGAKAYLEAHSSELESIVVALETDMGAGPPVGFGFDGSTKGREFVSKLLEPLEVLGDSSNGTGTMQVRSDWSGKGVDIAPMVEAGVPGLLLRHADTWWFGECKSLT